ncbi:MAG: rRNA pseudouridine synthase [Desulfobacterales bacterium]|nr:rRNA pseudouridine synthase [Desulfobacterales bacterium]
MNQNRTRRKSNHPQAPSAAAGPSNKDEALRINRILSLAGLTSRRKADEWIKSRRVTVNGRVITELGVRAVWGRDRISVDGNEIRKPSPRIYLMLNKPFGYISALSDPQERPLVTDLLKGINERVYPVGRLDFDTLGLLLFTNDGEWAHRLTHPSYKIPRTYKATVAGNITREAVDLLSRGVQLEDGPGGRAKATVLARNEKQSTVRITIAQGRYRQVRRMFEAVGFKVVHLIRIGFGELSLGDLGVGEYRLLETSEVESVMRSVGMSR